MSLMHLLKTDMPDWVTSIWKEIISIAHLLCSPSIYANLPSFILSWTGIQNAKNDEIQRIVSEIHRDAYVK